MRGHPMPRATFCPRAGQPRAPRASGARLPTEVTAVAAASDHVPEPRPGIEFTVHARVSAGRVNTARLRENGLVGQHD